MYQNYLITGATGTNVNDLSVLLIGCTAAVFLRSSRTVTRSSILCRTM